MSILMNIRGVTFIRTPIISLNIALIYSILAINAHAEVFQQNNRRQNIPLISPKCNEFTFDASKSHIPHNQNISYFWDFGDGYTSLEPIVTHTYQRAGDYTVTLSIADNINPKRGTEMTSQLVRVNIPPKVSLSGEDRSCINKPLTFNATTIDSNGRKDLNYFWNFGDGTISRGKSRVTKAYKQGGDYKVLLTVSNQTANSCGTKQIEKIVHINAPPQAETGHDVILRCVTGPLDMIIDFDASATTDVNNDFLSYLWDFGDGTQKEGREVSHRYQSIKNYDAKLIVSDNTNLHCGTSVDFVTIKFNKAPKAEAGEDAIVCAQDSVTFDGSGSFTHKKGTEIAQWFFGDGIAKHGLTTTHRYSRPGIYQATLSLENKLNKMCPVSKDTRTITVNSPPIVSIKSPTSQCVGKTVFFDAASAIDSDGDQLKFYWNFGDGLTSQIGAKVSHRYNQGGNYRISVVVDDQKGTSCSTATAQTHIRINTPPIANAGPNNACCADKRASFSASGSSDPDGDQLTYTWNFGDGTQKQGENVTHAYTYEGSYNAMLTVNDQSGGLCGRSTDSFVVRIKENLSPVITVR